MSGTVRPGMTVHLPQEGSPPRSGRIHGVEMLNFGSDHADAAGVVGLVIQCDDASELEGWKRLHLGDADLIITE